MADETPQETPHGAQQDAPNGASEEASAPEPHEPATFSFSDLETVLKRMALAIKSQADADESYGAGRSTLREQLFMGPGGGGLVSAVLTSLDPAIEAETATAMKLLMHRVKLSAENLAEEDADAEEIIKKLTQTPEYQRIVAKILGYQEHGATESMVNYALGYIHEVNRVSTLVMVRINKEQLVIDRAAVDRFLQGLVHLALDTALEGLKQMSDRELAKRQEETKRQTQTEQEYRDEVRRSGQERQQEPKEPSANNVRALYNKDRHHVRIETNLGADVAKLRDLEKFISDGLKADHNEKYNELPYTADPLTKEQLRNISNPAVGFYFFKPTHIRAFVLMQGSLYAFDAVRLLRRVIDMVRECNHYCDGSDNRERARMQEIEHLASVLAERFGRIYHMMPDEALLKSFFYTSPEDGHTTMRYVFTFGGKPYAGPFSVEGQTSSAMFYGPDLYGAAQSLYAAARSARHVATELANSCENYEYTFENRRGQEEGEAL